MADFPKKEEAPSAPASHHSADWVEICFWILCFLFGVALINGLASRIPEGADFKTTILGWVSGFSTFKILPGLSITLYIISAILFVISAYYLIKLVKLKHEMHSHDHPPHTKDIAVHDPVPMKAKENERWIEVEHLIQSESESMWRMAILEADIMLGEMLTVLGYEGEEIGDRLKQANPNEFTTLNEAWEAHKVRNRIAHEGSEFKMSHEDAQHVISLYEMVFKEFEFI